MGLARDLSLCFGQGLFRHNPGDDLGAVKAQVVKTHPTTMDYEMYAETTISYDYDASEVEVYTTCIDVYEDLLARSTRPKSHRPLEPGYELIYRLTDCHPSTWLIK